MPATVYTISDNVAVNLRTLPGVTVLVTVPAAFSGTCTMACVPEIVENAEKLKNAGADLILIVSEDQPHAIKKWVETAKWNTDRIAFASDFGKFELKAIVGKLADEKGKENLPPTLGELLRRSVSVLDDGAIVWQHIEPDSGQHTLDIQALLAAVKAAKEL